jgi:succinyl-CoA synthetase beta subunit
MARVDVIAQGIIEANKTAKSTLPVVARLAGTNLEEGVRLLAEAGIEIERAEDLGEAAQKAVAVARR